MKKHFPSLMQPKLALQSFSAKTLLTWMFVLCTFSGMAQVPDAPTNVSAIAGVSRAFISFSAPVNNGGSAITNYEYSLNNGSWTLMSPATTESPLMFSGLTNCTSYSIKIRAVNGSGGGTASSAVTVTPRDGQLPGIQWTAPFTFSFSKWKSVTFGNGKFVALSLNDLYNGSKVMTSPDGKNWSNETTVPSQDWRSIAHGNGKFVAVARSGTGNRVMTSTDGSSWTSGASAADNEWMGVTYGNGLFVAVAQSGAGNRVMTSPDGITWTIRSSAADNNWTGVTYGNGLFVAVAKSGTGNRVMTSTDGISWTSRSSAADNEWISVSYGNGLFVAVAQSGSGNRVMTSPDGTTWTIRGSAADNAWTSVNYGGGLFVAVSADGTNRVMTSPDGINWTGRPAAAANDWQCVAFGSGSFVALSGSGFYNNVMNSSESVVPDKPVIDSIIPGADYIKVAFTAPADAGGSAITNYEYSINNGSTWVTPGPASVNSPLIITGVTPLTSYQIKLRSVNGQGSGCASDGVNTSTVALSLPGAPNVITVTAGIERVYIAFSAPANDGGSFIRNYEYSLDDGSTWTTLSPATVSSPLVIEGLTNCTSYPVKIRAVNIVGSGGPSSTVTVRSRDGQNNGEKWVSRVNSADNLWTSITYGNGLFVAVSFDGTNRVMTSPDGINWTSRAAAANSTWKSVTYGNGLFVAVSGSGEVMTSPDGIAWTSRTPAVANAWTRVTYGNGLFVAVGQSGTGNRVMTSPDGINWTSRNSAADIDWLGITYGNGRFVAVGSRPSGDGNNRVMTSPDGINWTLRTAAEGNSWYGVAYGNSLFVAVSTDRFGSYQVMTSPDGITWTGRVAAAFKTWSCITYGNGIFVALAQYAGSDCVMTSPDGITWTLRTGINNPWNSVIYGKNMFAAVATSGTGNRVMTSLDLVVPDRPVITSITPSVNSVSFDFTAPVDTGASAILNYQYSVDSGNTWITRNPASASSPITISPLTQSGSGAVKLRAVNTQGPGCASNTFSPCSPTSSTESYTACDSYLWNGTTYTTSGTKTWKGTNAAGCDSVVTLNLIIKNSSTFSDTKSACVSYLWNGTTYTTSGTKTWKGTNAAGCDSIVTLNLTINSPNSYTETKSACVSYLWNGTTYTTSGTRTWTGTNAAGCDSVVTLNLTIKSPTSSTQSASACVSYLWNGTTYTTGDTYTWKGTNAAGCDSVVTLNLTIKNSSSSSQTQSACDSYIWNGTTYTTSGTKTWTGTNRAGCDSVVTLNLTITQSTSNTVSQTATDLYTWPANGTTYYQSGSYTSVTGCNTQILNLTIIASCKINSGSYVGNGLDNRTISGLGFNPAVVIVKSGSTNNEAQIRTAGMPAGLSKQTVGNSALYTGRINSFTADGFIIGKDNDVNQSGKTYYWTAIGGSPSVVTGDYLGTGVNGRSITGVGFSPALVMLIPADGASASWRSSSFTGSGTASFGGNFNWQSTITAQGADGFTVGNDPKANKLNSRYYYVAFKPGSNVMRADKYTGSGVTGRVISMPGMTVSYMFIKSEGGDKACLKMSAMPSANSIEFNGSLDAGRIYNMGSGGFTVGNHGSVNKLNEVYHYVAFGSCSQQPARPSATTEMPREITLSVFPNPAVDNATLAISNPKAGDAILELMDGMGRRISNSKINLLSGENYYGINTSGLEQGMYLIRLIGTSGTKTVKLMVGR